MQLVFLGTYNSFNVKKHKDIISISLCFFELVFNNQRKTYIDPQLCANQ